MDIFDTDWLADDICALVTDASPAGHLMCRLNLNFRPITMARHENPRNSTFQCVLFYPSVPDCGPPLLRSKDRDVRDKPEIRLLKGRVPYEIYGFGILGEIIDFEPALTCVWGCVEEFCYHLDASYYLIVV